MRRSALDPLLDIYRAQAALVHTVPGGPWGLFRRVGRCQNRRSRKRYTIDARRHAVRELVATDRRRFAEFGPTGIVSMLGALAPILASRPALRRRFRV